MLGYVIRGFLFGVSVLFCGCSSDGPRNPPITNNSPPAVNAPASSAGCDPSLWKHVYDPTRLEVLDQCKTVTGTIDEQDQNEDGDTHMLLRLDPGQEQLLAKRNLKKKDGDLVIEVVCGNRPAKKKAQAACADYSTGVAMPKVGDHVRVTGTFVNDTHNGWNEIHPVTSIDPI